MAKVISRFPEGISLNGKEFILESDNSKVKQFESDEAGL
jgi:hypothetical protein